MSEVLLELFVLTVRVTFITLGHIIIFLFQASVIIGLPFVAAFLSVAVYIIGYATGTALGFIRDLALTSIDAIDFFVRLPFSVLFLWLPSARI